MKKRALCPLSGVHLTIKPFISSCASKSGVFFPSCNAFSIRDIRLRTEVCDSSDSKKTILPGYIRARVAGAREE